MITHDMLEEVLNEIPKEKLIEQIWNQPHDWISMEVHVTNVGHTVQLESRDWSEEVEEELVCNGQMFCDKDQFLSVLDDNGIDYHEDRYEVRKLYRDTPGEYDVLEEGLSKDEAKALVAEHADSQEYMVIFTKTE